VERHLGIDAGWRRRRDWVGRMKVMGILETVYVATIGVLIVAEHGFFFWNGAGLGWGKHGILVIDDINTNLEWAWLLFLGGEAPGTALL
jgi:hypothetical protein